MTPKIQLRRLSSLLYRTGLKKVNKNSSLHLKRTLDARFKVSADSEQENELANHSTSDRVSSDKGISGFKNKLYALKTKFLSQSSQNQMKSDNLDLYNFILKKGLAKDKDNYSTSSEKDRFIKDFTSRISKMDKKIKHKPFYDKFIELEEETVNFVYNYLLTQLFALHADDFIKHPLFLFKNIQETIAKSLDSMMEEFIDLSNQFSTHHFMRHLGLSLASGVSNIEVLASEHANIGFVPYYAYNKVKEISVY